MQRRNQESMKIGFNQKQPGWSSCASSRGAQGRPSSGAWQVEPRWGQHSLPAPEPSGLGSSTLGPPRRREGSRSLGPEGSGQLDLASQRKIISPRKQMKYLENDNLVISVGSIFQVWGRRITRARGVRPTHLVLVPDNKRICVLVVQD
jgi:hypothetical protein